MNMKKSDKKTEKQIICFSKKIVISCILFIVLYTIFQVFVSFKLGIELTPALTACVYAFFGTELAACALIRIFDSRKDNIDDK